MDTRPGQAGPSPDLEGVGTEDGEEGNKVGNNFIKELVDSRVKEGNRCMSELLEL